MKPVLFGEYSALGNCESKAKGDLILISTNLSFAHVALLVNKYNLSRLDYEEGYFRENP